VQRDAKPDGDCVSWSPGLGVADGVHVCRHCAYLPWQAPGLTVSGL